MQRLLTSAVVPAFAALLAAASPALGQDAQPAPPRIADNVVAGGVDLSGLTAAEASAKLQAELAPRLARPVVVRIAGRRFEFDGAKAKVKLDTGKTVAAALVVTAQPPAPQAGGVAPGASVPLVVSHARIPVKDFAVGIAQAI